MPFTRTLKPFKFVMSTRYKNNSAFNKMYLRAELDPVSFFKSTTATFKDLHDWVTTYGKLTRCLPEEFTLEPMYIIYNDAEELHTGFVLLYNRTLFEYALENLVFEIWYAVPRALLLPFVDVPLF